MTRFLTRFIPGLLLVATTMVSGFAPNSRASSSVNKVTSSPSFLTATALNVVFEDKPHMMIGGRGYSHLVVDPNEFTEARAAALWQKKKTAAKMIAGYMAVVCGSLLMRKMLGLLVYLPYYYKAYPLAAAMATCGIKSMTADAISQVKTFGGTWDWKRSLSGLTYGAAILGAGSKMAYSQVLPRICPSGMAGIVSSCVLDNFLLAPAIWLPGAYIVKALFYNKPVEEAVSDYVSDIREESLLSNYWKLWVPAQFLNFAIMPKHLQVPFVAAVGFIWYFVLSKVAFAKEGV